MLNLDLVIICIDLKQASIESFSEFRSGILIFLNIISETISSCHIT